MKISVLHPVFNCFVIGVGILLAAEGSGEKRIVCFYNSRDSGYKHPYNYQPRDIPTELCTDLVYASAAIDEETWEVVSPYSPTGTDIMRQFTALETGFSGPTFFLSVGGSFDPRLWSEMAGDASKRLSFVTSVLHLLRDYGFNGLNLYWSTPGKADRDNYVKLVEELVEAFKPSRLRLTGAVSLGMIVHDFMNETVSGFNIQRLSELFDWINVVDHTLRAPWKNDYVDVPSPLYRRSFDGNEGSLPFLNLHDGLEIMGRLGAPRHKLMLGIPFSGLSYTLRSSSDTFLTALVNTSVYGGEPGFVTKTRGFLYYYEICRQLASGKWQRRFDHEGKCPYAFRGDQWVGYEDEQSIRIKMEYVKNRGFGGANVWAINMDDFNGFCGSKNPLLRAIHDLLGKKLLQQHDSDSAEEMLRKRYKAMGISTCNEPPTA